MLTSFIHALFPKACILSVEKTNWTWNGGTLVCPVCGSIIASCNFEKVSVPFRIHYKYLKFFSWVQAHVPLPPPSFVDPYGVEEAIRDIHKRDPALDVPLISDNWDDSPKLSPHQGRENTADKSLLKENSRGAGLPHFQSFFDGYRPPIYNGTLEPVSPAELLNAQREFEQALA